MPVWLNRVKLNKPQPRPTDCQVMTATNRILQGGNIKAIKYSSVYQENRNGKPGSWFQVWLWMPDATVREALK